MAEPPKSDLPKWFKDTRKKNISTPGNTIFTILRLLDLPLQYYLLRSIAGTSIIRSMGGTPTVTTSLATTTAIGLSPYHTIVWTMAAGAAAKQIYWCLFICDNAFEPGFATGIAVYNSLLNTLNTLLATWALTANASSTFTWSDLLVSPPLKTSSVPIGVALYGIGILTEWWCEVQRKRFKGHPDNKGKLFMGGLFGLARNVNYGGYLLWRMGYGIVCAGLPWGVGLGMFLFGDFAGRAVPYLETYLADKVGGDAVHMLESVVCMLTV